MSGCVQGRASNLRQRTSASRRNRDATIRSAGQPAGASGALRPLAFGLSLLLGASAAGPAGGAAAFPGVEGHGSAALGGRGGRIIAVTNLADAGAGSLRACVLTTEPRICVFRVSGVIVLERSLLIDGGAAAYLSIYGQTAPGLGITLTVDPHSDSFMRTPLIVRSTHDVIVQDVRLRSQAPMDVANIDALTIEESRRVVVDHISGSWASDENVNTQGQSTEITISHSIFGEGLRRHSKCALLGSHATAPQKISFWRNLCISNNDRNPDMNHFADSCIEIVDNVFYNARSEWAEIFSQKPGGTTASLVGNYFKAGPSTLKQTYAINYNPIGSVAKPSIFASNNAVWSPGDKALELVAPDTEDVLAEAPACDPAVASFHNAETAYAAVLTKAGAFPRDAVDERFVRQVGEIGKPGKGTLRVSPGTIAAIAPSTPYADRDGDAIADSVEDRFGATVGVADGWTNVDSNGDTRLDVFMQWLLAERMTGNYPN